MNLWNLTRSIFMAVILLSAYEVSAVGNNHHSKTHLTRIRLESAVHLRARPRGPIVGTLHAGQVVLVDQSHGNSQWLHVHGHGKTGYIFRARAESVAAKSDSFKKQNPTKSQLDGSDNQAEGQFCATCSSQAQGPNDLQKLGSFVGNAIEGTVSTVASAPANLVSWLKEAWTSATKPRERAQYLGGGIGRGNHPKGKCAQAAKEALKNAGICPGSLEGPSAISLHRDGHLLRECPRLKLSELRDPAKAPNGSVIIYSGYAGKRPHSYGHIEAKLVNKGSPVYCSDFCSHYPTKTSHNQVEAIYVLN